MASGCGPGNGVRRPPDPMAIIDKNARAKLDSHGRRTRIGFPGAVRSTPAPAHIMTGSAFLSAEHQPVLLDAVLQQLDPKPGGRYCDATLGLGGHAQALLEHSSPDGRLIGLDRDRDALQAAAVRLATFGDRVSLVHAPFSQVQKVLSDL